MFLSAKSVKITIYLHLKGAMNTLKLKQNKKKIALACLKNNSI